MKNIKFRVIKTTAIVGILITGGCSTSLHTAHEDFGDQRMDRKQILLEANLNKLRNRAFTIKLEDVIAETGRKLNIAPLDNYISVNDSLLTVHLTAVMAQRYITPIIARNVSYVTREVGIKTMPIDSVSLIQDKRGDYLYTIYCGKGNFRIASQEIPTKPTRYFIKLYKKSEYCKLTMTTRRFFKPNDFNLDIVGRILP